MPRGNCHFAVCCLCANFLRRWDRNELIFTKRFEWNAGGNIHNHGNRLDGKRHSDVQPNTGRAVDSRLPLTTTISTSLQVSLVERNQEIQTLPPDRSD